MADMYAARAVAQASPQADPILDRNAILFTDKDGEPWTAAFMDHATTTGEYKRSYPGGSLAAQEIGFVAYKQRQHAEGTLRA